MMQSLRFTFFLLLFLCVPATHAIPVNTSNFLIAHILLVQTTAANEDDAAKKAREKTGGRVLSGESAKSGGSTIYLVKVLLPSGTVRVVKITGK